MIASAARLAAITVVASLGLAVTARGVSAPPTIPNVPTAKPGDTARFKLTVRGHQFSKSKFFKTPEADGCSNHIEGTLNETWDFARGKGVTIEFVKYGKRVYMKRAGRQLGDTAFATKGTVRRMVTGFHIIRTGPDCVSFPLADPSCGQEVKAPLDLRVDFSGGKISLKHSGPAAAVPNPAEKCGLIPLGGTSVDELTNRYPFLGKQSGALSSRQIFKTKKSFEINLEDHFVQPLYAGGFTTFTESTEGLTTVTLDRK